MNLTQVNSKTEQNSAQINSLQQTQMNQQQEIEQLKLLLQELNSKVLYLSNSAKNQGTDKIFTKKRNFI